MNWLFFIFFLIVNFFLDHPLERWFFIDIELKFFNTLQLLNDFLLFWLFLFIISKITIDSFIKLFIYKVNAIDAIKLINWYDKAFVYKLLNDFDLHIFILSIDFLNEFIYGIQISHTIEPSHQSLTLFHHLFHLIIHKT